MIKVIVAKPEKEVREAASLIRTFFEKNNLSTKLTIVLDYGMKDCGAYYYYEGGPKRINPNKIYINPYACYKNHSKLPSGFGFFEDYTVAGVIIHEFCHYIDNRLQLVEKFESSLTINSNCKTNKEKIAELMRLYLTNPYLLWLISEKDYIYFRDILANPTPCSKERFLALYDTWTKKTKMALKKTWGIHVEKREVVVTTKSP